MNKFFRILLLLLVIQFSLSFWTVKEEKKSESLKADLNAKLSVGTIAGRASVGMFLKHAISLFDGFASVPVAKATWMYTSPVLQDLEQTITVSNPTWLQENTPLVLNGGFAQFGFVTPGEYFLTVTGCAADTRCASAQLSFQVYAPSVENVNFARGEVKIDKEWLTYTPINVYSTIRANVFPGFGGFVQVVKSYTARKDNKEISQSIDETQHWYLDSDSSKGEIFYNKAHLFPLEAEVFDMNDEPGVLLIGTDKTKREWVEYSAADDFLTFAAFQPDQLVGCTRTFIVVYSKEYIRWGWSQEAVRKVGGPWSTPTQPKTYDQSATSQFLWILPDYEGVTQDKKDGNVWPS